MEMGFSPRNLHYLGLFLLLGAVVSSFAHGSAAAAGASFTVRRKSPLPHHGGRGGDYLVKLRREDSRRHLAGVDLAIGGKPTRDTGLYYTSLSIGTPAENYFLEIDVGLDYNVKLTSIDVAGRSLELPNSTFAEDGKSTIDTSTSLTYLPEVVYKNTIDEVFYNQPHTIFYNYEDFLCFHFSGRVDEAFPTITFHFDGDLALSMHPHDYLLHNGSDLYCVGFQNGRSLHDDRKDTLILGDLSLSDKLVIYDLERQVIGWTEYDCSSSIKLKDEQTGSTYDVHANRISSQGGHCHVSVLLSMFLVLGSYLI
ncbi:hypothetical protein QOZ80_3BG0289810 [Eleusine coracana subsp. coracana]|nr:hypothetical protein QOZ80_3BG0289810 [Eleusine coracana subsp. coracana]